MYQIVSKTGLVIEEFRDEKTCREYMEQAIKKGSPDGWLSIRDENGMEVVF